jgi:ligand-binding sensor domain-containing protein
VSASIVQRASTVRTLDPTLAAFRSTLGLDTRARRWPVTSFVRGERTEEYWFGTAGNFLFRFDALRGQPEWFWYGAPSRGVSSLALRGNALWLGSDGRGRRNGVSSDPASTVAIAGEHIWIGTRTGLTHIAGSQSRSILGAAVYRVRLLGDSVWVAAANGLYHTPQNAQADSVQLARVATLPNTRFVDAARVGNRMFAITDDALFIRDSVAWRGPVRLPAMVGLRRLTVLAAEDSALWIGGVNGLARYQPDSEQWLYFLTPGDLPAGPVDIMPAGEHVWLATPAGALRLYWRKP